LVLYCRLRIIRSLLDRQIFSYLNLLIIWSILILLLTLIPFGDLDRLKPVEFKLMDKMVHLCIFGIHSFLLAGYLKKVQGIAGLKNFFFPTVITVSFLFSFFIEGMQYFIPERSFEFFDLIANLIGIMVGMLAFYIKFNFFTN
jgi:glycopeptide antibiotics resistance protein